MMFKCHICRSAEYRIEYVSEIFQANGKFHLVENIPAIVCSQCREEIFSREDTERIRLRLYANPQLIK